MGITAIEAIRGNQIIAVQPGEKASLETGDTLRVHVGFNYVGQEQNLTLYGAIGSRHPAPIGFTEHLIGRSTISCPDSLEEVTPIEDYVDIEITSALATGTYDLYCKIEEFPDVVDELAGVIDVTRVELYMPWWGLAIVGVLGVLGVGAALALAGPRRRP